MPWARRLAWIAGATALVAVVIAAVLALPDTAPVHRDGSARSAGSAAGGLPPDAAAPGRPVAAAPDGGSGSDADPPERLVASARSEVAAGNLARARSLLARAYAIDPRPATLLELAAVDFQSGHCREARRAVQRVIADGAGELSDRAFGLLGKIGRCD